MNYFKDCQTMDQAKNTFRKLCKTLHPDINKSKTAQKDFIEMMSQYENFIPSDGREKTQSDNVNDLYNLVKSFDHLNNVTINFVGTFIWLSDTVKGSTKDQKELIKNIKIEGMNNARFAPKKVMWYFSPVGYSQKFKSKKTFDEIKKTWGATSYESKGRKAVNN